MPRQESAAPQNSRENSPYSMTEAILLKRLNKPIYGHILPQIFAGILACLASLSFGTTLGWAHSVLHFQLQEIESETILQLGDENTPWLVSIGLLGCTFGVSISSILLRQMGPKRVLQVVGPFYMANWWIILSPDVKAQLAGRFFLGLLGMAYSSAGELLLLQTIHYGIRRYINVFYNSSMIFGVLISRVVGTALTKFWLTIICAMIPTIHYVLIQIVPESPVTLYATSHSAAAKSLSWYRGKDNFYMDMLVIKKDWDASRQDTDSYSYMLFSKTIYRPLLIVIAVTIFQITTGYFVFMFYSIKVLTDNQVIVFDPVIDSAIIAFCFIFTKMLWGSLHTAFSWRVRPFLISSTFFCALCLLLLAAYLMLGWWLTYERLHSYNWCLLVIVALFIFSFDMGLNHFPKILIFEYMPAQMYKNAFSMVQTIFWLCAFFNIFFFSQLFNTFEPFVIFGFLSGVTFLGALFCYFCVVEPKGRSLIQLQLEFGGNPIGRRGALYHQLKQTL